LMTERGEVRRQRALARSALTRRHGDDVHGRISPDYRSQAWRQFG
jgi:hypothetical protein